MVAGTFLPCIAIESLGCVFHNGTNLNSILFTIGGFGKSGLFKSSK